MHTNSMLYPQTNIEGTLLTREEVEEISNRISQKLYDDLIKQLKEALVPSNTMNSIQNNELDISPELEKKIKEARRQYKNGETISCKDAEGAIRFLESL